MIKKNDKNLKEQLKKIHKERDVITSAVKEVYKTTEGVEVNTKFKEVTFMLDPSEFLKNKNFTSNGITFTYEQCDKDMLSLRFKYV